MDLPPEFLTLYSRLDRQGPGTPEDVLWALARLGLSGPLQVCDAGCGTGADSATLAEALPEAQVEGLDAVPAFIEAGQARVADLPNATLRVGDMAALEGPYDLIWSAGAIYFLGVTEGLRAWRAALAPGGTVAFSQGVFLGGDEPQAVRAFWAPEPALTDREGCGRRWPRPATRFSTRGCWWGRRGRPITAAWRARSRRCETGPARR